MKEIRLRKLNNKGLSLVEVVVALAIASIVAILIMSLVTSGSRFTGNKVIRLIYRMNFRKPPIKWRMLLWKQRSCM